MAFFLFGKKRSTRKKTSPKKPPAKILRMCKKLKIKCTVKRGSKRVYRKVSVLKKLISRKMKKACKGSKTAHRTKSRKVRRSVSFGSSSHTRADCTPSLKKLWPFGADFGPVPPGMTQATPDQIETIRYCDNNGFFPPPSGTGPGNWPTIDSDIKKLCKDSATNLGRRRGRGHRSVRGRFGFGEASDFSNAGPAGYGYNQPVVQKPGILDQSSQIVSSSTNGSRPPGLGLPGEYTPTYGVYRPFFGENVPTQVGPNWNFMGQPDGSAFAVGGPFNRYLAPASFGRRGRREFGGGGCGSTFMKRDSRGKCVFKSKSELKEKAKDVYSKAKKTFSKSPTVV